MQKQTRVAISNRYYVKKINVQIYEEYYKSDTYVMKRDFALTMQVLENVYCMVTATDL